MKTQVGLNDAQRTGAVALLAALLADEYLLYTKTRNYHWNVTGPQFHDLHKFFESQYEALDENIDDIAEFIRSLGEPAPGTLAEFLKLARIKEAPEGKASAPEMLQDLLADHESISRYLRQDLATAGDKHGAADVADFLTGLLEQHAKTAWMLRATLE